MSPSSSSSISGIVAASRKDTAILRELASLWTKSKEIYGRINWGFVETKAKNVLKKELLSGRSDKQHESDWDIVPERHRPLFLQLLLEAGYRKDVENKEMDRKQKKRQPRKGEASKSSMKEQSTTSPSPSMELLDELADLWVECKSEFSKIHWKWVESRASKDLYAYLQSKPDRHHDDFGCVSTQHDLRNFRDILRAKGFTLRGRPKISPPSPAIALATAKTKARPRKREPRPKLPPLPTHTVGVDRSRKPEAVISSLSGSDLSDDDRDEKLPAKVSLSEEGIEELAGLWVESQRLHSKIDFRHIHAKASRPLRSFLDSRSIQQTRGAWGIFTSKSIKTKFRTLLESKGYKFRTSADRNENNSPAAVTASGKSPPEETDSPGASIRPDQKIGRVIETTWKSPRLHALPVHPEDTDEQDFIELMEEAKEKLTPPEIEFCWLRQESHYTTRMKKSAADYGFILQHAPPELKSLMEAAKLDQRWSKSTTRIGLLVRNEVRDLFNTLSAAMYSKLGTGFRRKSMRQNMYPANIESKKRKRQGKPNGSNPVLKPNVLYKIYHSVGDDVFACTNQTEDEWVPCTVKAVTVVSRTPYGDCRTYNVVRKDNEEEFVVTDVWIKTLEDYLWVRNNSPVLNGIVHHMIDDSTDDYLRIRGWFVLDDDRDDNIYTSVCDAMRAYDDSIMNDEDLDVTASDLNMPEEWNFGAPSGPVRVKGFRDIQGKLPSSRAPKNSIQETTSGVMKSVTPTSKRSATRLPAQSEVIDLTVKKAAAKSVGRSRTSRGPRLGGLTVNGKQLSVKTSVMTGKPKAPPNKKSRKSESDPSEVQTDSSLMWNSYNETMLSQEWNANERRKAFVKLYLSDGGECDNTAIKKRLESFESEEKILSQHQIQKALAIVATDEGLTGETRCYQKFCLERLGQFFSAFRSSLEKNEPAEMTRRRWDMFGQQEKSMLDYHLKTCHDKLA